MEFKVSIDRHVESEIERLWGITTSVTCPAKVPKPGDVIMCDMTHEGQSYVVRSETRSDNKSEISIKGSDSVLFPKALLESVAGVPISCSDRRYLRVELGKSGYCKIAGSPTYLRITLDSLEPAKWSRARVLAEDLPADARMN
ncbi:MAG TPA: hypothetical protein VIU61_00110 [Kofleriaceae bacterium]